MVDSMSHPLRQEQSPDEILVPDGGLRNRMNSPVHRRYAKLGGEETLSCHSISACPDRTLYSRGRGRIFYRRRSNACIQGHGDRPVISIRRWRSCAAPRPLTRYPRPQWRASLSCSERASPTRLWLEHCRDWSQSEMTSRLKATAFKPKRQTAHRTSGRCYACRAAARIAANLIDIKALAGMLRSASPNLPQIETIGFTPR